MLTEKLQYKLPISMIFLCGILSRVFFYLFLQHCTNPQYWL